MLKGIPCPQDRFTYNKRRKSSKDCWKSRTISKFTKTNSDKSLRENSNNVMSRRTRYKKIKMKCFRSLTFISMLRTFKSTKLRLKPSLYLKQINKIKEFLKSVMMTQIKSYLKIHRFVLMNLMKTINLCKKFKSSRLNSSSNFKSRGPRQNQIQSLFVTKSTLLSKSIDTPTLWRNSKKTKICPIKKSEITDWINNL